MKQDNQQLKQEYPLSDRERIITNLVFRLGDVCYVLLSDINYTLRRKNLDLHRETKMRFNRMLEQQKLAEKAYLSFTSDIRKLDEDLLDQFINDADLLRQLILLLVDKSIGEEGNLTKIWDFLKTLKSDNKLVRPDQELEY